MKHIQSKILKNKEVAPGFFRMRIASGYLARSARPGQFVQVKCGEETDPLLRRPIGINRVVDGGIELLYEVVGKGTELMSRMKEGDICDLIGPLGNGFDITSGPGISILVAGGNGVAPLLALADKVKGRWSMVDGKYGNIVVLIGARTETHILCVGEFKRLGAKVLCATEDGSRGHKGLVTHLLSGLLLNSKSGIRNPNNTRQTTIYACGPTGMLKAVSRIAQDNRVPCQVSLEEHMACGVGVCLGCPVKIKRGYSACRTPHSYKMVCKDGPVFNSEDIIW